LKSSHKLVMAAVVLAAATTNAEEPLKTDDPLAPVQVLEGVWQGKSEGFGQTSTLTHEWERILDGHFMRLKTRSVSRDESGVETVHEDVGYVSYSEGEGLLRFRQFLSEGFVNTFRLESVAGPLPGFNFEPESTEGMEDLVARMTLRFTAPDAYEMVLELGSNGKPPKACQTMQLTKVP